MRYQYFVNFGLGISVFANFSCGIPLCPVLGTTQCLHPRGFDQSPPPPKKKKLLQKPLQPVAQKYQELIYFKHSRQSL